MEDPDILQHVLVMFLSVVSLKTGTLPLASQESMIVEDLLYVLIGVDGRYITAQPLVGRQNRAFLVDPNLDLSIKELVTRILPVAASYSAVTRYRAVISSQWRIFSFKHRAVEYGICHFADDDFQAKFKPIGI